MIAGPPNNPRMDLEIAPTTKSEIGDVVTMLTRAALPVEDLDFTSIVSVVGRVEGNLVAHAALEVHAHYGLIRSVVVSGSQRSRGFGKILVEHIEDIAFGQHNLKELYLLTETAESFFNKRGYRTADRCSAPDPIKESSEFSHVCAETAVLMVKPSPVTIS